MEEPTEYGKLWIDQDTIKVSRAIPAGVYILILAGESNSRGHALNSDLLGAELEPRNLQVWNRDAAAWQASDIDTNSFSVNPGTEHGLEVALANYFDDAVFGPYDVRLLKAGSGGSQMIQWTGVSETLQTQMIGWTNAAAASLAGQTIQYLFWWSQGINDSLGTSFPALSASEWKAETIQFFGEMRTQYGATMPIVCTELPQTFTAYNDALAEIATEVEGVFVASSISAELRDANHWSANGLKTLAPRMLAPFFAYDPVFRRLGPVIATQPPDTLVYEGSDATITAAIETIGTATAQWEKSDNAGSTFADVADETSEAITISSATVAADDADIYRIKATEFGWTRTSRNAVLSVDPVPSFDPSVELVAKLVGWYRSDFGTYQDMNGTTTPATSEGNDVKTWVCKIASGNFHSTGDTGPSRFAFNANVANGQIGLYNDGVVYAFNAGQSYTIKDVVIVAKYDGATISQDYPGLVGRVSAYDPQLLGAAAPGTTFLASPFLTWTYRKNGAIDVARNMPMNAAAIMEYHNSTGYTDTHNLGQSAGYPTRCWKGWVFEVLFFNDELTTQERSDLNGYLADRYGISL